MAIVTAAGRKYDARPDSLDFRDRMYRPALLEVPPRIGLAAYRRFGAPVLDQGDEGACTGFGLAAVASWLLRRRESSPDVTPVSPRMLYEMARRYDEWEGEGYEGASARGAMKGWHKHGVCGEDLWPYQPGRPGGELTPERIADAATRPLGAYYRVNHQDLVAMHAAVAEVGVLYATAMVHAGWDDVDPASGVIPTRTPDMKVYGGHAFAIVAYDERGFWLQNSWSDEWGFEGFALLTYEDWLLSATDVWVARLGVPITVTRVDQTLSGSLDAVDDFTEERQPHVYSFPMMRPHVVALGDDGELARNGTYRTNSSDLTAMIDRFETETATWETRRLALFAHGGLVSASRAVQQASRLRSLFLENQIYPLFFVWNTDWYSTLRHMLDDVTERWVSEAPAAGLLDFLQDRFDDMIESAARSTRLVKAGWDEIKENGIRATSRSRGGGRQLAKIIADRSATLPFEVHLVGHSAGSILLAALAQHLAGDDRTQRPVRADGLGVAVDSCVLWAPAVTVDLFEQTFAPLLDGGGLKDLTVFALRDRYERKDSAGPYQKSVLYLVSNALERTFRIPLMRPDGEPLLGLEKHLGEPAVQRGRDAGALHVVAGPTAGNARVVDRSEATTHVGFSTDQATHLATIARIQRRRRARPQVAIPAPAAAVYESQIREGTSSD